MARNFLGHGFLPDFLVNLATRAELHGPVLTDDGVMTFGPVRAAAELQLGYRRTLIPPKKFLLHPCEPILTYAPDTGYRLPDSPVPGIILFGLHPCDLQGIAYLDRVFLGDTPDPLYRARRSALTLVGLSCEPDEFCFCGDLAEGESSACDLFMRQVEGGFELEEMTPKGAALLEMAAPHLAEVVSSPPSPRGCALAETIRQAAARGERFGESPLWGEFAGRCLSCGACSLCCPTCYCFDIREYGSLDGETATRLREWDNCLFKVHGEVAGGGNFRTSRVERFRYRYQHKYLGFGPTRGVVSCVGCGRCRAVCPVGIDLLELFKEGGHDAQP